MVERLSRDNVTLTVIFADESVLADISATEKVAVPGVLGHNL